MHQKNQFILSISFLLIFGFLVTNLASFFISRAALRSKIDYSELPLTSDNIYSEIQRDILKPVFISSLMASDTFLRDWVLQGELDEQQIRKYLNEIYNKYNTITSFFVSEGTYNYYHLNGILKTVHPDSSRDIWYFRMEHLEQDYETNVDPDMANNDQMTIFVNHKVFDYNGNYIGATGIGLALNKMKDQIQEYQNKYQRSIYFVDAEGNVVIHYFKEKAVNLNIYDIPGLSELADDILAEESSIFTFERDGKTVHLNARYIPELKWFLLVEQEDDATIDNIYNALKLNSIILLLVGAVIIFLINFTINAYRKKLDILSEEDRRLKKINAENILEINKKNAVLKKSNEKLEIALKEVKTLSGLLPVCASCKKIRDDQGYWNSMEKYISEHSNADFSHGLCPDCMVTLYPDIYNNSEDTKDEKDS